MPLNINFLSFQTFWLDWKNNSALPLFSSSAQLLPYLSFASFSPACPFSSRCSHLQRAAVPSVALSRTKPGFVYMVTERRDGRGWRRRESDEQGKMTTRTHTHTSLWVPFVSRLSWIPVHVTVIRRRQTDCSLPAVRVCELIGKASRCLRVGR